MRREQRSTGDMERRQGTTAMERHLRQWEPLVRQLSRRFAESGECEDLEQIARVALWQAAQRFDPGRGFQFYTFAYPTVLGALQRYVRDCRAPIRVPRRCWDLCHHLKRMEDALVQELGRAPSVAELAVRAGVSEKEMADATGVSNALRPLSLDAVYEGSEGESTQGLMEKIGTTDPVFEATEQRIAVRQAIDKLPTDLRDILQRLYFQGWTSQEVAWKLGVSQAQAARLERRALALLRQELREAFYLGPTAIPETRSRALER
jgi:RNA polymerase sigma-B factor